MKIDDPGAKRMVAAAFKTGALLRTQRAELIELASRIGNGVIDARSVGLAVTIMRQGGIRRVVERANDQRPDWWKVERSRLEPIAKDWSDTCTATEVYAQPICKREGKRVSNACAPKASPGVLAGSTIFYGAPTPIYFEDTQGIRAVQARYALVPAEKLLTSHDPAQSFSPTPGYPQELQERDYEGQRIEQEKVRSAAASIRPELIVSTNADALTGPPVIDRRGIVLGGNGRSMALKLAFRANDYRYTEGMRRAVRNDLSYGLFGAPIEPGAVLVRVLERVTDPLRISRLLNSPLGAAQTRETEAISLGQRLGVRSISEIANNLEAAQTLNEAIRAAGRRLVEALSADGILTPYNRAQWLKTRVGEVESELNRFAIERLVDSIVAVSVNNLIVLREASPSQLTQISAIAPWVLLCDRFDRRDSTGYNFGPAWRRALPWWIDSEEKRGGEFFSYWFTGALFGEEDAFAVQRKAFLADVPGLQAYAWMFSGGQLALADGARRLWRSIPQQFTASGRSLLDMSPTEIVDAGLSPEQLRRSVGMPCQAAIEVAGPRELMQAIASNPAKLAEWKFEDRSVAARYQEQIESWAPGKIEKLDDSQARAELERSLRGEDEAIDFTEWKAPEPRRAARPKKEKTPPKVKDPWRGLGLSPKLRIRFASEFEEPRALLRALQRGEKIAGYPNGNRRTSLTDKLSSVLGPEPEPYRALDGMLEQAKRFESEPEQEQRSESSDDYQRAQQAQDRARIDEPAKQESFNVPGWNFWTVETPNGTTTQYNKVFSAQAWNGKENVGAQFEFTADDFEIRAAVRSGSERKEFLLWDRKSLELRERAIGACKKLILELEKEREVELGWLDPLELRISSFLLAGFEALEEIDLLPVDRLVSLEEWGQQIARFCAANASIERWESEGDKSSVALERLLTTFDIWDVLPFPATLGSKLRAQYSENLPASSIQKGAAFRQLQKTLSLFPKPVASSIAISLRMVIMPRRIRFFSDDRLSNSDWKREGKPNWWLRNDTIEKFISLDPIPGSSMFDQILTVPPGNYVLGVGKNPKTMQRDNFRIPPALLPEWVWS